jgi:hypothetical protein
MRRLRHKRLLLAIAAAAVIAGLAAAVVMAAQPGTAHRHQPQGALATAAAYLGTSARQLRGELRSGKSLAQLAQADGKSVGGLTQTLEAAAREKLEHAQADLSSRVAAEVHRVRTPGLAPTAARYLGLSTTELRRRLRSGETLAQLATGGGHSQAGLVEALLAARKVAFASRLESGQISRAREAKALSHLRSRIETLVQRKLPARPARRHRPATR